MPPRRNTCTSTGRWPAPRAAFARLPSMAAAAAAGPPPRSVRRVNPRSARGPCAPSWSPASFMACSLVLARPALVPLEPGQRGGEGDRLVQLGGAEAGASVDVLLQRFHLAVEQRLAQQARVDALREPGAIAGAGEVEPRA